MSNERISIYFKTEHGHYAQKALALSKLHPYKYPGGVCIDIDSTDPEFKEIVTYLIWLCEQKVEREEFAEYCRLRARYGNWDCKTPDFEGI